MRLEIRYAAGSLEHPKLYLPVIREDEICNLLQRWGLAKKNFDCCLLHFEFLPLAIYAGQYAGQNGNRHIIRINHWYIQTARNMFNAVVIHELRHMFWNISKPVTRITHINKEGFVSRSCTSTVCCNPADVAREEKDCMRAEEKYKDFNIAFLIKPSELQLH